MALSKETTYLQELIATGADAQSNLYKISFSGGKFSNSDTSQSLSIRASAFNPPAFKPKGSYSVRFVNAYINRPLASTDVTRQFDITFRLDSNYKVYQLLRQQRDVTFDPELGFTATDLEALKSSLFSVTVNVIDKVGGSLKLLYQYNNCWISDLSSPSYTTGESKEATIKATIHFLDMEDYSI